MSSSGAAAAAASASSIATDATAAANAAEESKLNRMSLENLLSKELRAMMYGFGDEEDPLPETVRIMEDMVLDYMGSIITEAESVASGSRGGLRPEHILFVIHKDRAKLGRAVRLLKASQDLQQVRREIDQKQEEAALDYTE